MNKHYYTGMEALAALLAGLILTDGTITLTYDGHGSIIASDGTPVALTIFSKRDKWYEYTPAPIYELRTCLCTHTRDNTSAFLLSGTQEYFDSIQDTFSVVKVIDTFTVDLSKDYHVPNNS